MDSQLIVGRPQRPALGGMRLAAWLMLLCSAAAAQRPGSELEAFKLSAAGRGRAADAAGIYNDLIAAQVGSNGRFNFGAFPAGGASLAGSQSFNLSFAWPSGPGTSFTTVQVNGGNAVFGQPELPLVGAPSHAGDVSTAVADNNQVRVVQTLSLVNGPNSGRPDTVRIAYQVTNLTTASQQVGVRVMIDTMLAGNDAAPFRIPGLGAITTERLFEGPAVPSFWQAFQSLEDTTTAAQGTLLAGGAVTPTRFALANWGHIQSTLYDFTPNDGQETGDSGIGIWWDNLTVAPQQTIEVATFYGLGDQTVAQGSVNLGVSAPAEVSLAQPHFQIAATVENPSAEVRSDVIVDLALPAGFTELAAARSVVSLGDLQPGQSAAAVFDVDASGATPGAHAFVVKAGPRADALLAQVTRPIQVTGAPAMVVDPAHSFFLLAPDSPIDPSTGQAPLGAELSLLAQLNDANGQPVPGVASSRVTYTVTPSDAAQLTPQTVPSDADGAIIAVLIGLLRGEVTVTAAVDGASFGSPVVVDFQDVRLASATFDLNPGLHLLTQPVTETNPNTAGRGLGLVTPVYYDAIARQYYVGEGLRGQPGLGFFIRNSAKLELSIPGFLPASLAPPSPGELLLHTFGADEPVSPAARAVRQADGQGALPLYGSWNLVGNPFGSDLEWRLERWRVIFNGLDIGTLADPMTWDYVSPYAFVYGRQGYELIFDRSLPGFEQVGNRIGVLRGFWIRRVSSSDAIVLQYLPEPAAEARASGAGPGWAATLTASSGGEQATVTVGAGAAPGRALSIARPPAIDAPGVDFGLVDGADRLAGQIVNRAGEYTFTAEVTGRAGRDVTLTWSGLGRALPAGYDAVLTDLQTGRRLAMRTRSLYVYASQGETRRFTLQITRRSGAPLLLQVQAAPTRSRGAGLTLLLNQPAEVHLVVQSLSGRLVREVTTQSAGAGATTVTWDGLDQTGRRAPAGLYQILAVAESDAGELARAVTTVNVR